MDLITLDYETYYDQEYSLSKLTTEEYIRDPRFETIGVSVKRNANPTEWFTGSEKETKKFLRGYADWHNCMALSHNGMFDMAILGWRHGIEPKALGCTLSMSRGIHGPYQRHSLAALAEQYNLKAKGTAVHNARGMRRADFSSTRMAEYADYCMHDTDLCWQLFNIFIEKGFPADEMKLVDMTLQMFTKPQLELDRDLLEGHLIAVKRRKEKLVKAVAEDPSELRSPTKFAELLRAVGVEPGTKISPKTGKEAFAFAKTDDFMRGLQEHPDDKVQALAAAKLGTSSTLEETRTQRFIDISKRGAFPIPLKYYAAHTGRWGGDDKVNLQNLPSRDAKKKALKDSIVAPEGYTIIDCDSSQIEARVLAWLAEQNNLVEGFANGEDVYKDMASGIYNSPVDEINGEQRFVGKSTILGAGYNMGGDRFQEQLAANGFEMENDEAHRVIGVYRKRNPRITDLWKDAQFSIKEIVRGKSADFGRAGIIRVDHTINGLWLPNGMPMSYTRLREQDREEEDSWGTEFVYNQRAEVVRLYGGKLVENVCQALARIIVGFQMLRIRRKLPVVCTVHDSAITLAPDDELQEARAYVEKCMRKTPSWAKGLPITCESAVGKSYGRVKE